MGRLLARGLLAALSALLVLALAEGALRLQGFRYNPLDIEVTKPGEEHADTDWRDQHSFGDEHFAWDPDLFWRPVPGLSVFNAQGFRGKEVPFPKPEGACYVFTIGDSNTLGNAGGSHWPGYLSQRLRSENPAVRVVNAGVWGYTAFQGLARLEEVLPLEPDVVLISFGANDAHRVRVPDRDYASWRSPLDESLGDLRLYQAFVAWRDRSREAAGGALVPRVSLEDYRALLETMVERCEERGIAVVLLTRPFQGKSHRPDWWKNFAPDYNRATLEIAAEHELLGLDVHERFDGEAELFVGESHFNDRGNRVMAKYIADQLAPVLAECKSTVADGR